MLVGINFTGESIDIDLLEGWRKALHLRKNISIDRKRLLLKGVADDRSIKDALIVADNGRRIVKVVIKRKNERAFYGIYIG